MYGRLNRITYEEVIDGANANTSERPLHKKKGLDLEWEQEHLKRVDILSIWLRLTEESEK